MLDRDFLVYAINDKLDQADVSDEPNKLHLEINMLYRRLKENDKNMHRLSGESNQQ